MSGRALPPSRRLSIDAPDLPQVPDTDALIDELEAELDKTARLAGLGPDDPLWPVLQSWKVVIRATLRRAARSDQIVLDVAKRFEALQTRLEAQQEMNLQVLREGRKNVEGEMKLTCFKAVGEIGVQVAESIERSTTRRNWVLNLKSVFWVAFALMLSHGGVLAAGRLWEQSIKTGEINAVVGDVQLSLGSRLQDATALALLAERNPLAEELRGCFFGNDTTWKSVDGRSMCAMPVYIDMPEAPPQPPPQAVPQFGQTSSAPASPPVWALPGAPPTGPVTFPSQP